jgi:hypothetical protein
LLVLGTSGASTRRTEEGCIEDQGHQPRPVDPLDPGFIQKVPLKED